MGIDVDDDDDDDVEMDEDEVDHAKTIRNAKKAKKDIRGVKKGVAKKGKVAKKKPAEAKKKSLRSKKVNNRNTEESSSNDIKTKTARALEDPSSSNVLNMQSSQLKEDQAGTDEKDSKTEKPPPTPFEDDPTIVDCGIVEDQPQLDTTVYRITPTSRPRQQTLSARYLDDYKKGD